MTSWLARLGGKSSSEEEEPATVAHMGEANKMYYDEKRKRWVERGKEDEIEEEEELKPPPLAFTKREAPADSAPATGGNDFMAQLTRPVALGSARSRYVDPFASMGASSSSSEPPASKEPPKLLPPPNPFGGLLPGPPTLAEEENKESTSPKIHKVQSEEDTPKVDEGSSPKAPTKPPMHPAEPPMHPAEPPMHPAEPPMPPGEPSMPAAEPPMPSGEPSLPPGEPSMPPGEPSMPPGEPSMPPAEPPMPPGEPSMPPMQTKVESPSLLPQGLDSVQQPSEGESLENLPSVQHPPPVGAMVHPSVIPEHYRTPEEPLSSLSNSPRGSIVAVEEEEPARSEGDDVWEAPAWGQEIVSPAAPPVEEEGELDFDDILGGNAWETEEKNTAVSPQLRERDAEVPDSPAIFSDEKAAASPLKATLAGDGREDIGWGALLSNDEWADQEGGWTVVAEDKDTEEKEEGQQTNDRAPGEASPSTVKGLDKEEEEKVNKEGGAASSLISKASDKSDEEKEDTKPQPPVYEEKEEEDVVAGAGAESSTAMVVDNEQKPQFNVEKEDDSDMSEGEEADEENKKKLSSDVIDSPPSPVASVEESGEEVKEGDGEDVKRTISVDFFDQILGDVTEKAISEPKQEEEEKTPTKDIPKAPPMMMRTPSPPTVPAPTLPLMLPKTPESSEEGNKEGAIMMMTDGGYSSDGGHASSTPRAAESASIAPTKAPWKTKTKTTTDGNKRRQRSVSSDVLLPPAATGSLSPDNSSRGDLSRPPPSPVHSTRDSFDRTYRARIADHSKRIQCIEEKMCDHGNAFEEFIKKTTDMMVEMKDNIKELRDEVDAGKAMNEELRGKVDEQRKQLDGLSEVKDKQEEIVNELKNKVTELSSTVAAVKMADEVDDDTLMKDMPDFIRTRDREDILAFVQNLLKAKKKQEAMYQSRMETGSVYSQRSRSVMQPRNGLGRGQLGDSSSPASSISRIRRAGSSSTNKWRTKRGNRSFISGPSQSYPVRSFHRLMEEYDSDDDGRDDLICSPEGVADTAAASPTSDLDDSRLSEIHSSSALIARLDYLGNQCQYSVPSSTGREETEAARTTLEDGATSTDPAVASAFSKTMEIISFSWDSSALPRNPLLTKATLFKAFSYMPAKLEELLKGSTRSPLSSGMQRQIRAMLGAMWNITLNEDSSQNPILIQGAELLPSLVQVLARYSVDDRDICKNACGLLLTLMTNDSKLCRNFLAIDGGLSVLTSVLRTHKFEQEDAATEQALQCIFLLATVAPECRPTLAGQIDRFTLDRLQGIRHASRLRDILYRSSSSSTTSKSKFLAPPPPTAPPPRNQ